ncbi:MAG TPA: hypothetical protein VNS12_05295 [Pelagibacterium sp.]|uniref:hypothetical protein n=1 Tax=Pelagibacterium sp. TaxID=1967288 RepID=UPI002D0D503C|nr:hypothetical protein [Pelagibacterium sp.]HWJ87465.1 hypothetical protein [Pelagibacterium sp.]
MTARTVIAIVFGAFVSLAGVSQAQAYKLHYWQDGTVSWMCNDGITVGVLDDGSEPEESVVIAACAAHGGMSTVDDVTSGAGQIVVPIAISSKMLVPAGPRAR